MKTLDLVSFQFQFLCWYIKLCELFNAKAILVEEQPWYYLTHSLEDKRVHAFSNGISLKVNVIMRLDFELAYFEAAVQHFRLYVMMTPPNSEFSPVVDLERNEVYQAIPAQDMQDNPHSWPIRIEGLVTCFCLCTFFCNFVSFLLGFRPIYEVSLKCNETSFFFFFWISSLATLTEN